MKQIIYYLFYLTFDNESTCLPDFEKLYFDIYNWWENGK